MFECGSLHMLDVSVAYTFPPSTLWYRGKTFTDKVRLPTLNLNLRTYYNEIQSILQKCRMGSTASELLILDLTLDDLYLTFTTRYLQSAVV